MAQNKLSHYLQTHLKGEVTTSKDAREFMSTDGSVLTVEPQLVIYPRNTDDIRKTARFTWQLAQKGKSIGITARGKGTDQAGGALGSGIMMAFPAHMRKLLVLGKTDVTVQPGIIYRHLQDTLLSHGRYLPPYPSSIDFSTIGGAVANNAAGELTIKYGATKDYTQKLTVVLANGEVITTGRLTRSQLSKKMGETSFEAEIYRQVDTLIMDNWELIADSQLGVTKNSAGYNLYDVKRKDGSFDLTPLFVGSQGTLGIITQIKLKTESYNPNTNLIAAYFDDLHSADAAVRELEKLGPAALEFVDENLLNMVHNDNPKLLGGLIKKPFPKIILLCEFDDSSKRNRTRKTKKAKKILAQSATEISSTSDPHEQETLWQLRHSAAAVMWQTQGTAKALPVIEDGVVPNDKFVEFIDVAYKLFAKYDLKVALWGHAGNSNIHMQPFLDLSRLSDRQKMFKLMDDFYRAVIAMGGSTCGEHNDGRLRAPYLPLIFGEEMYALFKETKKIFDPYNTMNPGVKIDVKLKDLSQMLRKEYSMEHLYDHMPRT